MKRNAMWEYIPLDKAVDIFDSQRKPINNKERAKRIKGKSRDKLFPYYGATGLAGYIDNYIFDGDYVLLGEDGAPFLSTSANKAYLISGKSWVNNHAHILKSKTNNLFLCHYLNYFNYKNYVSGTTRMKLTQSSTKSIPVPIPTINEQQRIVDRIEELFSQLDKGVETLQTIKRQLAVYRQAVLKEAFEWNYHYVSLKNIAKPISGHAFKSKKYAPDGDYVVVKIGNIKQWHFDFSRDLTRNTEADEKIISKYLLQHGDILITLTGSRGKRDYGYVTMVDMQSNFLLNQRVAALRFDANKALPKFYQYYLASPNFRDKFFSYETGNVGQGNVGIKALQEPNVIFPTLEEQQRIIQAIESRLSACDSIEQTVDATLAQAEALRQSILKKAFEGGFSQ